MIHHEETARLRRLVYVLLITVVVGAAVGRILAAERLWEPSLHKDTREDPRPVSVWPAKRPPALPTFSSNDRARWATVRALVDHGTYAIGVRESENGTYSDRSIWRESGWESGWDTVDKVLDPKTKEFHSSKPPLLSTILAAIYWLLQQITGWTLAANIWEVVRTMLLLVNVLPFVIYLGLLARLVERFAFTDYARLYVMAAACFATLVTPFLVTINNHTIATFCVLFALYPALLIICGNRQGEHQGDRAPWDYFAGAGLFSAFAACIELPAAAFTAGVGLMLLIYAPRKTLLFFVPAAALPVAGFFLTNWQAVGQLVPIQAQFGSEWYLFEGSHWQDPEGTRRGIDFARNYETEGEYAFHLLLGHHGLFSLTPMWLLAFVGMIFGLWLHGRQTTAAEPQPELDTSPAQAADLTPQRLPWWFFPCSLLLSLVVIAFYLIKTDNYGGWTSGLRWLMWLTPIWLLCMLPVLDKLSCCRWGRGFGYVLLAFSVLSVSYPAWNPWRHPWIYRWLDAQGWIPY